MVTTSATDSRHIMLLPEANQITLFCCLSGCRAGCATLQSEAQTPIAASSRQVVRPPVSCPTSCGSGILNGSSAAQWTAVPRSNNHVPVA